MDYRVHLKQFDGPLDLLLHLIEKAEVDIQDIFVSEITTQYLEYMKELDTIDMDTASEFLTIAAQLVFMKSKTLLPKNNSEEDTEQEDTEESLIRRLREYKMYKQLSSVLSELMEENKAILSRPPDEFKLPAPDITWIGSTAEALFSALNDLLSRAAQEEVVHPLHRISADRYTVRSQARLIRSTLTRLNRVPFISFFDEDAEKLEVVVTFMAMLEMASWGEISFEQTGPYKELYLQAKCLIDEDKAEDGLYSDEVEGNG